MSGIRPHQSGAHVPAAAPATTACRQRAWDGGGTTGPPSLSVSGRDFAQGTDAHSIVSHSSPALAREPRAFNGGGMGRIGILSGTDSGTTRLDAKTSAKPLETGLDWSAYEDAGVGDAYADIPRHGGDFAKAVAVCINSRQCEAATGNGVMCPSNRRRWLAWLGERVLGIAAGVPLPEPAPERACRSLPAAPGAGAGRRARAAGRYRRRDGRRRSPGPVRCRQPSPEADRR